MRLYNAQLAVSLLLGMGGSAMCCVLPCHHVRTCQLLLQLLNGYLHACSSNPLWQ